MSTTYINKLTMKTSNPFTILHTDADPTGLVYVQASTSATVFTGAGVADAITVFSGQVSNARIKTVMAGSNEAFANNNLSFEDVVVSQDIYGGALALDAKGKVNKVGDGTIIASVDSVSIDVAGGQVRTVFGGGAGYGSSVDEVFISIEGARVNQVYGGGAAGAVVGDVEIEIGGATIAERGSRIGAIYGGGKNATVTGDVQVSFTAGSAALKFSGTVSGNGTGTNSYVLGEKTLTFEDYIGQFSGRIQNFDTVQFVGSSQIELTKSQDKTMVGADYEFVLTDDSIGNSNAMLTWNKKFTTGTLSVVIADDGDYNGESTAALLAQGATVTLVSSKNFKTLADFNVDNIRVENEAGELIADYSYEINYTYGKKGGEVSITYTGAPLDITGQYSQSLSLTSANDYVNVTYGSVMAGAVNMGAGDNKLVVQTGAAMTGEVIFAAGSTNTVLVNGYISGLFDSRAGSTNMVRLNPNWGFYGDEAGVIDFVGSGNDTLVLSGDVSELSTVNFGKGADVLVLNTEYDGKVSYEDGNDVIVANVNQTLNSANLGLQGTGNALVVGNGREVTIDNSWFGTGVFGSDTGAVLSGVYLNDNASLLVVNRGGSPDLHVIQNYTGDIMLTAGDIYIMGANVGTPSGLSDYYTNSGTGFNGNITVSSLDSSNNTVTIAGSANGTITLGAGDGDVVNFVAGNGTIGGADLYLSGVETINVATDVIAVLCNTLDSNPVINLDLDAKLVYTDKLDTPLVINGKEYLGGVMVQDLTHDVDFGDAAYLNLGNVVFQSDADVDANLTFNNQIVWFNGASFSLDSTFTFEGASALGFYANSVWDWQDTTLAAGATLGVYGENGATMRIDGQVSDADVSMIISNSALNENSMLGLDCAIYIQNWEGNYSDAANWIAAEAGTLPFSNLVVMNGGTIKATTFTFGANSDDLLIGNGVTMRGDGNVYDYITITGDADANEFAAGASDIYGILSMGAEEDTVILDGTSFHNTENMLVTDETLPAMSILIDAGTGNDAVYAAGATIDGAMEMGIDDNFVLVTGKASGDGYTSATTKVGAILSSNGGFLTVAVFDEGVLGAEGETIYLNALDNTTSSNYVVVGSGDELTAEDSLGLPILDDTTTVRTSGTIAADLVVTGVLNVVRAGVNELVDYTGVGTEETLAPVEISAGLTTTISGDINLGFGGTKANEPAGINTVNFGVNVATNGSYEDPLAGPDKHKLAEVDFLGAVTVNATGAITMGDSVAERTAGSNTTDVASSNGASIIYWLGAGQEGVIDVAGNVAVNVAAIDMCGQFNNYDQTVDVYVGEQAKIDMHNSTVALTVSGDVDMLAVGVNADATNRATIGLWRLDNWNQATSPTATMIPIPPTAFSTTPR